SGASYYFVAGFALGKKERFDRFSIGFLICLSVPLILSVFQVVGLLPFEYWDWVDDHDVGRASGTYQHPSEVIFFLVFAFPLALYRWENRSSFRNERSLLLAFFALATAGLVFTIHRAGWIVILVELCVWYGMKGRWKQILVVGLAVLIIGSFFSGWISFLYQDF